MHWKCYGNKNKTLFWMILFYFHRTAMQCYFIYFSNLCSKPKEIQLQSIMILNKFFRRSLCKRHIRGKKDITSFIISRMIICHQRLVLINLFSNFDRLCAGTQKYSIHAQKSLFWEIKTSYVIFSNVNSDHKLYSNIIKL